MIYVRYLNRQSIRGFEIQGSPVRSSGEEILREKKRKISNKQLKSYNKTYTVHVNIIHAVFMVN